MSASSIKSVDAELRASFEVLVLDLPVELLLALKVSMAVEIPHDVLGHESEDRGMVASSRDRADKTAVLPKLIARPGGES